MNARSLTEKSEEYFGKRKGKAVSVSDWCSWMGISLEEWQELRGRQGLKVAAKRIETKIRAKMEVDVKRPATVTTLLLKQLTESENREEPVLFTLKVETN